MFVTVIHHIDDPEGFQAAEAKALEAGLPSQRASHPCSNQRPRAWRLHLGGRIRRRGARLGRRRSRRVLDERVLRDARRRAHAATRIVARRDGARDPPIGVCRSTACQRCFIVKLRRERPTCRSALPREVSANALFACSVRLGEPVVPTNASCLGYEFAEFVVGEGGGFVDAHGLALGPRFGERIGVECLLDGVRARCLVATSAGAPGAPDSAAKRSRAASSTAATAGSDRTSMPAAVPMTVLVKKSPPCSWYTTTAVCIERAASARCPRRSRAIPLKKGAVPCWMRCLGHRPVNSWKTSTATSGSLSTRAAPDAISPCEVRKAFPR